MSELPTGPHADTWSLLRAELTNDQMLAAAAHLDECVECREALVDDVLGHALMQRSADTLAQPVTAATQLAPPLPPLGPLTALSQPPAAPSRRWVRPLLAVAASVALVLGTAAITRQVTRDDATQIAGPSPTVTASPTRAGAVQQARLEPVEGGGRGKVTMAAHVDDADDVEMTINVEDLPRTKRGQFYYAWLLEPETNKMLPLGVLGRSGKATFEVPASVLGRYRMIDVSLETDDGDPQHSVTSVLRGAYA